MVRIEDQSTIHVVPKLHIHKGPLLGGGDYGLVWRCEAYLDGSTYCGTVAMKKAHPRQEAGLYLEAAAYNLLRDLYGVAVPRFYGMFKGDSNGFQYFIILLDECDNALRSPLGDLPVMKRYVPSPRKKMILPE